MGLQNESAFTPMFLESLDTWQLISLQHDLRAHPEDRAHLDQVLREIGRRNVQNPYDKEHMNAPAIYRSPYR